MRCRESFVWREDELAAVLGLAQGVMRGEGPAVALVLGDPGSGKSRLLTEACSRITLPEQILLAGYEPETTIPRAMASGLLRRLAEVPGPGGTVAALVFDSAAGPVEPIRLFEAAYRALAAPGPVLVARNRTELAGALAAPLGRRSEAKVEGPPR